MTDMNKSLIASPILVLEDERINQKLIGNILSKMELEHLIVSNGKEGLLALEQSDFSIFIVDLLMPEMDGTEFIRELRKRKPDSVVIVQTTNNMPETIVDVMKMKVQDYLFKPYDPDAFEESIRSALKYFKYQLSQDERANQISMKLRSQLEWFTFKEQSRSLASNSQEKHLLYNLKTSMSQGAGIGALLSMLELLQIRVKKEGDEYKVPADLLDRIFKNLEVGRRMVEGIASISDILEQDISPVPGHASDISTMVEKHADELNRIFIEKRIGFVASNVPENKQLKFDKTRIDNAIEEVLINATKFSPDGGELQVFYHYSENYFVISVKNDIDTKRGDIGVPPEYEQLATEPFIRFAVPDDTVIEKEQFTIGLGLSVVQHIVSLHGGQFFIRNVLDHLRSPPATCVISEIMLPVSTD